MGIFDFLTKAAGFGTPEAAGGLSRKNLVEKVFAEFKRQLEQETTAAELALAQLTDEQTVERIEKEIRDNPDKYPLLTKYYLDAE